VKINDFIICDDVRQEVGNKFSLMGIYDEDIKIQTQKPESLVWPLPINLAIFCRVTHESVDGSVDSFEFMAVQNNMEVAKIQGGVVLQSTEKAFPITVKMPGFPLLGEGTLKFRIKFGYKGKWVYNEEAPKTINISVTKLPTNT